MQKSSTYTSISSITLSSNELNQQKISIKLADGTLLPILATIPARKQRLYTTVLLWVQDITGIRGCHHLQEWINSRASNCIAMITKIIRVRVIVQHLSTVNSTVKVEKRTISEIIYKFEETIILFKWAYIMESTACNNITSVNKMYLTTSKIGSLILGYFCYGQSRKTGNLYLAATDGNESYIIRRRIFCCLW